MNGPILDSSMDQPPARPASEAQEFHALALALRRQVPELAARIADLSMELKSATEEHRKLRTSTERIAERAAWAAIGSVLAYLIMLIALLVLLLS